MPCERLARPLLVGCLLKLLPPSASRALAVPAHPRWVRVNFQRRRPPAVAVTSTRHAADVHSRRDGAMGASSRLSSSIVRESDYRNVTYLEPPLALGQPETIWSSSINQTNFHALYNRHVSSRLVSTMLDYTGRDSLDCNLVSTT
eukprot:767615-Hanusia_phi.AAC.2